MGAQATAENNVLYHEQRRHRAYGFGCTFKLCVGSSAARVMHLAHPIDQQIGFRGPVAIMGRAMLVQVSAMYEAPSCKGPRTHAQAPSSTTLWSLNASPTQNAICRPIAEHRCLTVVRPMSMASVWRQLDRMFPTSAEASPPHEARTFRRACAIVIDNLSRKAGALGDRILWEALWWCGHSGQANAASNAPAHTCVANVAKHVVERRLRPSVITNGDVYLN